MHECDCGIFKLDDNRFEKKAGHDVKCGRTAAVGLFLMEEFIFFFLLLISAFQMIDH